MNYIQEINSFYDWLVENSVSGNAQALWHRLMAYCNKFGWKKEFTVANTRLLDDLSISRQELNRVRNTLIVKGRILYKNGRGSKAGTYQIIPFASQFVSHNVTSGVTQDNTQHVTQTVQVALPLNKLNQTKPNQTKKESKKESFDEIIASFSFCDEVKIEIGEYLKMRLMKKKAPTDYALKLVLEKLRPHSEDDQLTMLRASITNGWTDVYEPKKEEQRKDYDTVDKQYKLKEWI